MEKRTRSKAPIEDLKSRYPKFDFFFDIEAYKECSPRSAQLGFHESHESMDINKIMGIYVRQR